MFGSRVTINKENINPSVAQLDHHCYQKFTGPKEALKRRPLRNEVALDRNALSRQENGSAPLISAENPQHVAPYQSHIREYLQQKECYYQINPTYMDEQIDLNSRMRAILIDWLIDVNLKFKLLPGTLFSTVNLIDRFLCKENQIDRSQIQLVGIASLMIVAKFEEIYPPLLVDYVGVCDNTYTKEQILEMESRILIQINFNLTQTTTFAFLHHMQLYVNLDEKALVFARYIIENALFDLSLLKHSNLVIAAGAVFLAHKIFKKNDWKRDFGSRVGVSEKVARACAKDLFQTMQEQDKSTLLALKRKFMTAEFFEVAKYRIEKIPNAG